MIPMFKVRMDPTASNRVSTVLNSGMIGEGPMVVELTEALKRYLCINNLILLNSGTAALTMALRLIGVEGGEVITTPFTMIATNVAIKAAGGTPVFADVEPNGVNISPESIAGRVNKNTRAILAVHVAGIPCEMKLLHAFGVPVISDSAHAIGTTYHGFNLVHWADYSCFSFQSIKQLTTGDGGAIAVRDKEQYARAEKLKWFGMTRQIPEGMTRLQHQMTADVGEWGYKAHMNDIAAAIGLANLPGLDSAVKCAFRNAQFYRSHLRNIDGILLPNVPQYSNPSWFAFPIFVDDRDRFMSRLAEVGIETTPMWRRNDEYTAFMDSESGFLPNMTRMEKKIVFLPVGWWVTMKDIQWIVEVIREVQND